MREIIKLILRYHFTIIFITLEVISFSLIVMHNNYQRTIFSGYTASLFGTLSSCAMEIDTYFSLKETNDKLVVENTILRNELEGLKAAYYAARRDSLFHPQWKKGEVDYIYMTARTVNATFNKTKNYLLINRGSEDGVRKEMAVSSGEGVVGIVENVSRHYAKVLPLINTNLRISAKVKKNGYYGSLQWNGDDYRFSNLADIPFHVNVERGDTIVTSGFSSIFPEGILIGFVESVNKETANFLSIEVKLATDFQKISDVYVIVDTRREEKQEVEGTEDE